MINDTRALRALMQSDPHRPIYHFVSPEGHAMPFDPNGAIYWQGKYHLGFIHQLPLKKAPVKLGKHTIDVEHTWGHAVSTDLIHWSLYPDMLDVREGDAEAGIFSGGAFLSREGVPHVIYHGFGASANMVAYAADDELRTWKKFAGNPVLKTELTDNSLKGPGKYTAWDPEAWYDKSADAYYQISGGLEPALFKSKDMYTWSYLGDLIDKNKAMRESTEDVSCPDFFSLGNGKSMLLFISHNVGAQYYIGTFANDRFSVEQHGRMNWPGGTFFAPEQLRDDKGRNIIWAWVLERKPKDFKDYGWSGIMSVPRVVSLGADGKLQINPAEELQSIRVGEIRESGMTLQANEEKALRARGKSIELKLELSGGNRSAYGVKVFVSPDGREGTTIAYDPVKKELVVNFARSSVRGPVKMAANVFGPVMKGFPDQVSEQRAPFELKAGETLQLDIFLDRSVIEVFANGRQAVTQVVYPEQENSTGVTVFSGAERVSVKNIQSWTMAETNAY